MQCLLCLGVSSDGVMLGIPPEQAQWLLKCNINCFFDELVIRAAGIQNKSIIQPFCFVCPGSFYLVLCISSEGRWADLSTS